MRGDGNAVEFPEGTLWQVLEHYGWDLPGPRSGWITVKCGAHKDSHASCRVNNDLGAVACQACGFHGDVIKVIQWYEPEGTSFKDALRIAETITGVSSSGVRGRGGSSHRVPSGPRDRGTDRAYIPPRLRG